MTKKFGMIFALLGAMAFYGSNSAFSSPSEPTSLADYIKANRVAASKEKASGKSAKAVQSKDKGKSSAAKTPVVKKSAAKAPAVKKSAVKAQRVTKKASSHKRPIVQAKARVKTVVTTKTISSVDTMTTGSIASATGSPKYSTIINSYAASYGVPVALANAVISVESNYQPNTTGSAGEIGLMQIKLSTARGLGYTGTREALYNPDTNIRWGMKYLAGAHKLGNGTTCGTILRYNAGHGATRMNPISANYCAKVKVQMASM
ncbi:lytic transglycosylase domain-containing protein [Phyllobacterium zundukense]|uniref:Lytic transglycosylase n=1 Tax=Phyllobacterium zundukense TaxID=1867719 RepID=A0A2N9W2P4_9HYPH|nr:lytic transglycosylase domain-containing protein [Phyllobacterium zundukense]ATU91024.1 lytic transglycosylase [Phyllobacterium zundukense]PIO46012.1 lytic transglycosylase [Phyllobacterium zundukense]